MHTAHAYVICSWWIVVLWPSLSLCLCLCLCRSENQADFPQPRSAITPIPWRTPTTQCIFSNKTRCFRSSFSTHCRANPTPLINGDDRLIWGRLMIRFELSAGVASCPFDAFFDAPFPRFWANWKNFRLGSTCLLSLYSHVFVEQADKHWSRQSIIAGTVSYSFC